MNNKINYVSGIINENFYNSYIKEYTHTICKKIIKKMFENMDDDKYLDYLVFRLPSKDERKYIYNELWLLNIEENRNYKYFPVYISNINTSSYHRASDAGTQYSLRECHALSTCNLDENEPEEITLEELKDMIYEKINIESLFELLN